jgi:glycosyltransferase involved in cell wall biosynthesis
MAPIKIGFVLHVMNVAGAEVLVAETIRRLGARIEPVIFCIDEVGELGHRMREEGVNVVAFHRRPGLDVGIAWRMAAEIRARALDVVHAHQYTPFFYGSIAASLSRAQPRVIFTEHGRHFPDVVSPKRWIVNRVLFDRLADDVNAVCEFSARALRDKDGFVRRTIEVIPNGVDLRRYAAVDRTTSRVALGLDAERRYVAAIARFHPVKDHRTLLNGFAEVSRARPDVDLLLVGDGPLRPDLERLCGELSIADRVHFMGIRDDVASILRASDVFALTSVSEAASITLLEAMASELPVVVTAVGGNPEIVRDGTDGLLVPRRSSAGVTRALLRILGDAAMAAAMGRAGAERVRAKFTLDNTIGRYYKLYAGAVATDRRSEAA